MYIPPWFTLAQKDVGRHEDPDNTGPFVRELIAQAHCGAEHEPYCAIGVNAKLEVAGLRGTRNPSSQSFRHDPNFILLPQPALGCIVVFYRNGMSSGLGHVGFYNGEKGGYISVLGYNESDACRIEFYAKSKAPSWGLVGYYWPKTAPQPKIGAIPPYLSTSGQATGKVT